MVEAMQNWKPDFGINDVESLKRFLQARNDLVHVGFNN